MDSKQMLKSQLIGDDKINETNTEESTEDLKAQLRAIQYNMEWRVENLQRGVGIICGLNDERFPNTFQFALRYNGDVAIVSVIAVNLHRLGMRIAFVRLMVNRGKVLMMTRKTSDRLVSKLDMFIQELGHELQDTCCFEFKIYVEGFAKTYQHIQYDRLSDDQLHSSVQYWTDFKFLIKQKVFHAHKNIVSARSCQDIQDLDSIRLPDATDIETFNCFLRFLYTGRLMLNDSNVSVKALADLAEKYGLSALKQLCAEELNALDINDIPALFNSTRPTTTCGPDVISLDSKPRSEAKTKPDSIEVRFEWKVDCLPEANHSWTKAVIFQNQRAFHVSFRSASSEEGRRNPSIFVFSRKWPECGLDVVNIIIFMRPLADDSKITKGKRFSAAKWGNVVGLNPALDIFSVDLVNLEIQPPFRVQFVIDLTCKDVGNYSYNLRDITFAENLWSASINGRFVDAELVVAGRTFHVHKIIVAARSPVLKSKLDSDGTESYIKRVIIGDVDEDIFEELLYFIYTGSLRISAENLKLLLAAQLYKVKTLEILCRNPVILKEKSLQDLCSFLQLTS